MRLTNGPMLFGRPIPSLDGTKIFAQGKQLRSEVLRYDTNLQTFVPYPSLARVSAILPEFSRDGQWVTYVAFPEQTLWRIRVDGSDRQQLTFTPLKADSPRWSPDAQYIVFRASLPGDHPKIYLISRNGGTPQKLAPLHSDEEEGVATWSPDGDSIVFGELRWHPDRIAIHIMNLRTKQVSTVPGSRGLWTPRWSPSGRYLLSLTADAINPFSKKLLIFDFRSRRWKKLLEHSILDPVWSQDEEFIYFLSGSGSESAIFRIERRTGKLDQVVSLGGYQSAGFVNGLGLAPDGSLLIAHDVRNSEIYALDLDW